VPQQQQTMKSVAFIQADTGMPSCHGVNASVARRCATTVTRTTTKLLQVTMSLRATNNGDEQQQFEPIDVDANANEGNDANRNDAVEDV
jgi:hypothetical protein